MVLFRRYQELTVKDPPVIIIRFSDLGGSSRRDEEGGNLSEQWAIIRDGALISFWTYTSELREKAFIIDTIEEDHRFREEWQAD